MNEIEIETKTGLVKIRIVILFILFLVLYIILLSRAFQLQVLAGKILKERYDQQHAKVLEAKQLIEDLQHSLDKLNAEQKKQITDIIVLGVEKAKLQKEVDELKPKYGKLYNDVQFLQKTLSDLSILQEKEADHIISIYDQIYRKDKWPSFFMSFIMGIIASIIASMIYNSVTVRSKMVYLKKIIEDRLIHMKKE
jgi:predicted nuclease with TOPRIM domain